MSVVPVFSLLRTCSCRPVPDPVRLIVYDAANPICPIFNQSFPRIVQKGDTCPVASAASAKPNKRHSSISNEATSIPGLCLTASLKHGKAKALNHKEDGQWINMSAATFVERVKNVALGLAALGIRPGDRIALLSENRPEWSIVDLAILSLGAINVPIYTTQAVDQIEYILADSGPRAMFISNKKLYRHAKAGFG